MVKQNIKKNPAPTQCGNFTCDVSKNISRNPTANDCTDATYNTKTKQSTSCPQNTNQKKGGPINEKYITEVWNYSNSYLGASLCPNKTVNIITKTKC